MSDADGWLAVGAPAAHAPTQTDRQTDDAGWAAMRRDGTTRNSQGTVLGFFGWPCVMGLLLLRLRLLLSWTELSGLVGPRLGWTKLGWAGQAMRTALSPWPRHTATDRGP